MKPVNIAIVGVGYWGPNLVRNFAALEQARLYAVCDINQERLNLVKAQYPEVQLFKNFDDILKDPNIEAVAIALPAKLHYQFTKRALRMAALKI